MYVDVLEIVDFEELILTTHNLKWSEFNITLIRFPNLFRKSTN